MHQNLGRWGELPEVEDANEDQFGAGANRGNCGAEGRRPAGGPDGGVIRCGPAAGSRTDDETLVFVGARAEG